MRLIEKSKYWVIRFSKRGCVNRPFYHIVVMRNREPQMKKVRDQIGVFDPLPNIFNERVMTMDFNRLRKWLSIGARPSLPVTQLLGLAGYFPIHPTTRLEALRKQRAAEAAAADAAAQQAAQQQTEESSQGEKASAS